jgi:hypothetical protein
MAFSCLSFSIPRVEVVALLVRRQTHMLLHACPGGVVLKVEQVLCVPGQRRHPSVEVRALEV